MNLTETMRHAIAIAEAVCRVSTLTRLRGEEVTFANLKALHEPTYGAYTYYRTFTAEIKYQNVTEAYLKITLVEQQQPYTWNMAFIEYSDAGSFCGPLTMLARRVDGVWSARGVHSIASSSEHLPEALEWSLEWKLNCKVPQPVTT